jgi:hypothetical protein
MRNLRPELDLLKKQKALTCWRVASAVVTDVVMAQLGLWAALGLARDHHNFSDLFGDEMPAKLKTC